MIVTYNGKTPRVADGAFVAPTAVLIGDVTVGEGASIWYGAVLRGDVGRIVIGPGTSVQDNCVVHTVRGVADTIVGANCTIGHGTILHGCTVKDGAIVGMGSILLTNAVIGEQAMVAAGAVVADETEIPSRYLAAGVPARVKKEISDTSEQWVDHGNQTYRMLTRTYLEQGLDREPR